MEPCWWCVIMLLGLAIVGPLIFIWDDDDDGD